MNECRVDINTLSPEAVKEIQNKLGMDVIYLVAVGKDGVAVPFSPESVKAEIRQANTDMPIKTTEITSLNSAAYGSYKGSCCWFWVSNGQVYSFCVDNC